MAGGAIVNTWSTTMGRQLVFPAVLQPTGGYTASRLSPVGLQLTGTGNTAGNWLLAVVSWRQDIPGASLAGVIQTSSTWNVSDDAHNFWIPLAVVPPQTGVMRTTVWMAPAARAANWVFFSPTAFVQAATFTVYEVTASVPWYAVNVTVTAFQNQQSSITASQSPPSGLFSLGVIAYDLNSMTVTFTAAGWLQFNTTQSTSGTGHSNDVTSVTFVATTTGSSMTLSASATGGPADWSEVLITVNGLIDYLPFPYTIQLENWPVLITEMACGQILNQNWTFNNGISPWAGIQNATVAASSIYTFGASAGSLVATPDGVTASPGIQSEIVSGIASNANYTVSAWVTVPAGWASGAFVAIFWYTAGTGFITSSGSAAVPMTAGQQQFLTFTGPPPATAAKAAMVVQLAGTPASSVLMYVAFASLALAGSFENTSSDQLSWVDFSHRAIALESMRITRGIQYEQQSLEAGTASVPLANADGVLTAGNIFSPYYPYAGQTGVPFRVRAVWPGSATPYNSLFWGYTDDIKTLWDQESWYGYVIATASDIWSRLTAQMLSAAQEDFLIDNPVAYYPVNDLAGSLSAHNLAPLSTHVTPPVLLPSLKRIASKYGVSGVTSAFGATSMSLQGDPGGSGWSVTGLTSTSQSLGISLVLQPANPGLLPPLSGGIVAELWVFAAPAVTGIAWDGTIISSYDGKGLIWELTIGAQTGANSGKLIFKTVDKTTGAVTSTVVSGTALYNTSFFVTLSITQFTWSFLINGLSGASGSCNFANIYNAIVLNGQNTEWAGTAGFGFNGQVEHFALYAGVLPQVRSISHYLTALFGLPGDADTQRIPRVIDYGSSPGLPVLAMRSFDVSPSGIPGPQDNMTLIADTPSQIVSGYLTNVAASTLAAMFVDGTGALVYRRRAEWYNRTLANWSLGQAQFNPLNLNPEFTTSGTVSNWVAQNGASLTFSSGNTTFPNRFLTAAQWHGDGVTATPQLEYTPGNIPVTPGVSYQLTSWWYSPQGYATGVDVFINWLNAGHGSISFTNSGTIGLPAASAAYITASGQAPAGAAFANIFVQATGTPASSVQFYNSSISFGLSPGQVPFTPDLRFSDDRAQFFNVAVVTQNGTGEQAVFQGTDIIFTPTSGVTVTVQNAASTAVHNTVPYATTVLLNNTAGLPFSFINGIGSVEDFASWIVQTLGVPVLRVSQVEITPAATPQAMIMALGAEVGDTVTLSQQRPGAPVTQVPAYISGVDHTIDIAAGWVTTYELSPNFQAVILACDSVTAGVLDGSSLLGW